MVLEKGDMWSVFGKTDWFLITTNPIVRKDGAAVMGAGIAKEAASRYPGLAFDFGTRLKGWGGYWYEHQVATIGVYGGQRIGCFMVKDHWQNPACPVIIMDSVDTLKDILRSLNEIGIGYQRIDLNFPGIGNGKLKREDVLPIIEQLPDNVHVWEYE